MRDACAVNAVVIITNHEPLQADMWTYRIHVCECVTGRCTFSPTLSCRFLCTGGYSKAITSSINVEHGHGTINLAYHVF
jgi:hypothetical protein